MVSPRLGRRGASMLGCIFSVVLFLGALYYGVHIGGVYWRYYQLARRHAPAGQARAASSPTTPSRRHLNAQSDSILGQTPDFRIDRGGRPSRIIIETEYTETVDPAGLQPHVHAAAPRRGAAVRCTAPPMAGSTSPSCFSPSPRSSSRPSCSGSSPSASDSRPCLASWSPACCWAAACSASSPRLAGPGEVMHVLAELGVLLLLFEIGLETDLREMFRVGPASLAVAVVGVLVPFGLGYAYWACAAARRERPRRPDHGGHLRRRHAHRHVGRYHRPRALRPRPHVDARKRASSSGPR